MKRWAWLVMGLYFAALVVLAFPLTLAAFYPKWDVPAGIYGFGGLWCWIALMLIGQALLLLVPVMFAEKRLKSRRPLLVPVITSALLFALLAGAGGLALFCGIWGDKGPAGMKFLPASMVAWDVVGFMLVLWLAWGLVFWRFAESATASDALVRRLMRWLLGGSILEFLVAVPCHIATRSRNDCCAPGGSFLGLAFGISVMLMAFGPGVFFLFVERWRRLHPPGTRAVPPDAPA